MRLLIVLSFILLLPLFISCESTTETESPIPYVSLSVGDVRQYFTEVDSSYTKWSIIGKTHRTDGQKVFVSEYITDSTKRQFYNFIRDGYMYSTHLDINSEGWNLQGNPYVEQRLAKLYPMEGDKWVQIDGDMDTVYFAAKYEGERFTPAKNFKNVFGFTLGTFLTVYYAQGYGHIGITSFDGSNPSFVNYIKVNGNEYGEYVPNTSLPKLNSPKNTSAKRKFGFFGERLK